MTFIYHVMIVPASQDKQKFMRIRNEHIIALPEQEWIAALNAHQTAVNNLKLVLSQVLQADLNTDALEHLERIHNHLLDKDTSIQLLRHYLSISSKQPDNQIRDPLNEEPFKLNQFIEVMGDDIAMLENHLIEIKNSLARVPGERAIIS